MAYIDDFKHYFFMTMGKSHSTYWAWDKLEKAIVEKEMWKKKYEELASANENATVDPFDTSDL